MDHDAFVAAFVANWLAAVSAHRYMQDGNRFGNTFSSHGHIGEERQRAGKIIREAEEAWAIYQSGLREFAAQAGA